jgi:hypothetical protein
MVSREAILEPAATPRLAEMATPMRRVVGVEVGRAITSP